MYMRTILASSGLKVHTQKQELTILISVLISAFVSPVAFAGDANSELSSVGSGSSKNARTKDTRKHGERSRSRTSKDASVATDGKISDITKRVAYQKEILDKMLALIPQGRYKEAIPSARVLVQLCEQDWGKNSEYVATALHNLGYLYQQIGDYTEAEPIFLRALAIREQTLGAEHPDVARSLNGLALLYQQEGDYKQAEQMFERALKIKEKSYGNASPEYALEQNNLAVLYKDLGEYDKAESMLKNILAVFEKAHGDKSLRVSTVLNNLAGIYRAKGDFNQARALYERSIQIDKQLLASDHPDFARDQNNLALLFFEEGKYDLAEPLLINTLEIYEKSSGPSHPDLVPVLNNLAMLCIAENKIDEAIKFQKRADEISEQSLSAILSNGTEEQKRLFLDWRKDEIDATISLNTKFAPDNNEAIRLGLGTVLRRKGRVLDEVSHQLLSLRQHLSADDQKLLDEISSTRSDLSARILHGTGTENKKVIADLQAKSDSLEKEISAHSAPFKIQQMSVSIEAVQNALPKDMTLLEFAEYRLLDSKAKTRNQRYGGRRYVAYVLDREGNPKMADLGEAAVIDKGIEQLRASLKNADSNDYKPKARALDKLVMEPVRKLLGPNKTLIISPDAALNLLPFAALIDQDNKFLIEKYSIDYLTSGRDLLRMNANEKHQRGPLIVANPQFSSGASGHVNRVQLRSPKLPIDFMGVSITPFEPLADTEKEARAISKMLPDSKMVQGKEATETIIKEQKGPQILHIATHGFFLPEELEGHKAASGNSDRSVVVSVKKRPVDKLREENPLLRSGIVLSGANNSGSIVVASGEAGTRSIAKNEVPVGAEGVNVSSTGTTDDGFLTALEMSGIDLWGTKLVVLSACETGLGDLKQGEGVYGLRRAILIAGAETEIISLWAVSDQATAYLMIDFYKHLLSGTGRMESLREAQLKIMKTLPHPYYWAAFIPVGDWRGIVTDNK